MTTSGHGDLPDEQGNATAVDATSSSPKTATDHVESGSGPRTATVLPESESKPDTTGSSPKTATAPGRTATETMPAADALDRLTASGKQSESEHDGTGHESWPYDLPCSSIRRSGNTGGSRMGADLQRFSRLTTSQSVL